MRMDIDNSNFDNYINGLINQSQMSFSAGGGDYKFPPMYKLFLTDTQDTPNECISFVMESMFHKIDFDEKGIAKDQKLLCGIYTKDVAETKVIEVTEYALDNGYTFKCIIQKGRQNVIQKS
jgi:ATP-dependent Clp protease adaptor protein ClpS